MNDIAEKVIILSENLKHLEEDYYKYKIENKEEIKELTKVQSETNQQLILLNETVKNNVEATKECTKYMKEQLNKPNKFLDKIKWLFIGGGVSFIWKLVSDKLK